MPVYNGEKFIRQAINSILTQSFSDFELLIINDGSTDNSNKYIKQFDDPRIILINNKENIGLVKTLNKGLLKARGIYVARFDQDDISLRDRLKSQSKFLVQNKKIIAVCSWMITVNSEGKKIKYYKQKIKNYGDFLGIILTGKVPLYHPAVMFRKKEILNIGGYNIDFPMAEDYDLWRKMALERYNALMIPKFHLLQRVHEKNATTINRQEYINAGIKVQSETLEFLGSKNNCLSNLLNQTSDPCGKKYSKRHLTELVNDLEKNIINNSINKFELSKKEINSLRKKLYRRLGPGVKYIKLFYILPEIIFKPLIFILSPLLFQKNYLYLSKIYRIIQKIKIKFIS